MYLEAGHKRRYLNVQTLSRGNTISRCAPLLLSTIIATLAVMIPLTVQPKSASAEPCWMIGCEGLVGYIYIPETQLWLKRVGTLKQTGSGFYDTREDYKLVNKDWLFNKPGLPLINTTEQLMIRAVLLSSDKMLVNLKNVSSSSVSSLDFDDLTQTVKPHYYDLEGSFPMAPGTKLRILGYHVIGGSDLIKDSIFAIVLVIRDGKLR